MLERMRRQITQKEQRELIKIAKEKVPGIHIRTTFLVGHPGETEEEFQSLCDFVSDMKFDRVGVFQYSHEEDTSAHDMEDDVDSETKAERANRIMEIQNSISLDNNETLVGQTLKVLFDRKEGEFFIGRTEFDSPEVDNEVLVSAKDQYVRIGDFANVLIESAEDYDLYGRVIS
jgi:ribosomal protein S12 methylthiotransferase